MITSVNLNRVAELQQVSVRDGIVLRPMQTNDASALLAILDADPSIRERVTVASKMHNEAEVAEEVAYYQSNDGMIRYVMIENEVVIGLISLWRDTGFFGQAPRPNAYGFGYFLAPDQRGKGLITDGVNALMAAVQASLTVESFIALSEDDNLASIAVLQRLGFEPVGESYPEPTHGWMEHMYEKKLVIS